MKMKIQLNSIKNQKSCILKTNNNNKINNNSKMYSFNLD